MKREGTNDHLKDVEEEAKGKNFRGGAVVMLGPIPILVGSDPKSALLMMRNCPGHHASLGNGIQTWIGNLAKM